ncbi:MAG: hypothetical protein WA865_23060 [Spirulinaceae cyanobacterium]
MDTNFAKLDRIRHPEIENFKKRVYEIDFSGMKVSQWNKLLASRKNELIKSTLRKHLGIKEESVDKLLD